tara:strand:- start:259 stop:438 length:180 start_codon:yes stop_codon:yes gene_type:complete
MIAAPKRVRVSGPMPKEQLACQKRPNKASVAKRRDKRHISFSHEQNAEQVSPTDKNDAT